MSQHPVSHQNFHNREARKAEKPRYNTKQLLDYIAAAESKVPFRRRFSWIVTTCHTIESQATYSGYRDNIDEEIRQLFYNICLKCQSWTEASIVQVHLHVVNEMRIIQTDIETLCRKIGISPQARSSQECKRDNEKDREHLMRKTRELLPHQEFRDACLALENSDAEDMMHVIQSILSDSAPDHPCRNEAFKLLYSLSKRCQKFVTIPIVRIEGNGDLVESGGFGTIWRTFYNGNEVAVKALTFYSEQDNSKTEKMLRREILLWNLITQQRHPHILPLIGITESHFPLVKMVAPWQENGNLLRYVNQSRPTIINRLKLLVQVCSALRYLHNHVPVVIHADLKCANVLVDRNGSPCLADFGLATVRYNAATLTSVLEGGSTRWMAPELFTNPNSEDSDDDIPPLKVTRYSDIWSFGMLVLELLTGNVPFADKVLNPAVMYALMQGERPKRPLESEVIARGLNDELWKCLCRCWELSPEKRLQLDIIQEILEKLATQWHPMSSNAQGKMERNITTESMSVPVSVCSHIIGTCGRNIRQYESTYDVKIKLTEQGELARCEITGVPENVGEARATIERLTEAQVKRYQKSIFVPKHLHGYLIGKDGTRIRDFQSKYHVRVSFDSASNQATVQGAEGNVNEAVNELCQTVKLDKGWAPLLKLTVAKRAARRLRIEKDSIIENTGLKALTIKHLDGSDEHQIVVLCATNAEILDKAKTTVDQICHNVQAESELVLKVPLDLRGLILGAHWKTWTEIVLRCGGPEDPRLQSELIEMDQTSERVILRGHADLIKALEREIQIVLQTQKRDVYSILISARYHNDLRRSIAALQQMTGTLILLPGDKAYDNFNDPIISNRQNNVDSASIVKIVGTQDGYKQACINLNAKVLDIESTQAIVQIPLKYENVIYGQIRRRLADIDVRISPSIDIHDEYPTGPTNGQDWQVIKRYHGFSSITQEWTLRAATKESLDLARDMIKDAYKNAKHAKYIGFLAFPDKTKFGRIVGKNGETVQKLQDETNTTIRVPKNTEEDHVIQITGSAQDIEIAKTRIEDLVNNDPPSPTDRLFKFSRTLSSRTN